MNKNIIEEIAIDVMIDAGVDGSNRAKYKELRTILEERIISRLFLEITAMLDEASIKELKKELDAGGTTDALFLKLTDSGKISPDYIVKSLARFKIELTAEIKDLISRK